MKKIVLAVLIVFLAIGVSAFVRLSTPSVAFANGNVEGDDGFLHDLFDDKGGDREDDDDDDFKGNSVNPGVTGNVVSLSTLSQHNKQSDCWVAYSGKVYDLTAFLPNHPGSAAAIAPHCGTSEQFTSAFTKMHGTSKVSMLMRVGTLMGDFEIVGKTQ